MRRTLFGFVIFLPLVAITACGTKDTVSSDFSEWQTSGYKAETYAVGEYESLSTDEQQLITAFVDRCSVTNDSLQIPAADALINVAESDTENLQTEYDELQLDAKGAEFHDFLMKYFTAILDTGDTTMTSLKCTDVFDATSVLTEVNKLLEYQYEVMLNTATLDLNLTEVKAGYSFVDEQDDARLLVSDIQICAGNDAILKINELSPANNFDSSDSTYFLQYKITNLSAKSARVSNKFVLLSGVSVIRCANDVLGLKQIAELASGESAVLSVCLVGPNIADICWVNVTGHSYKLINVP